jgi:hypothetical protein
MQSTDNLESTSMILSIKSLQYPVYEEQFVYQTFESFLGQFSGIIGLFLGFDFYMISNAIYSFIIFILRRYRKYIGRVTEDVDAVIEIRQEDNDILAQNNNLHSANCVQKWLVNYIFKLFTIILFSYLTLRMATNFIQQYVNDKNQLVIISNFRQNISLPNSTFCIHLEVGELLSSNPLTSTYENDMLTLINSTKLAEFLGNDSFTNNSFLVHTIHLYLASMTNNEASSSTDLTRRSSNGNTPFFLTDSGISSALYSAVLNLEDGVRRLNITTFNLRQIFGKAVAVLLSLNVTATTSNANALSIVTEIAVNITTSVSEEYICYQIPFDRFPFADNQLS